jgi:ATP-binding cassette subfamily B protein
MTHGKQWSDFLHLRTLARGTGRYAVLGFVCSLVTSASLCMLLLLSGLLVEGIAAVWAAAGGNEAGQARWSHFFEPLLGRTDGSDEIGRLWTLSLVVLGVGLVWGLGRYGELWSLVQRSSLVTSRLRRALHRQFYRVGVAYELEQGSLPVADLFLRDTAQMRAGLEAWWELLWRQPLQLVTLVGPALLLAPDLAVLFLAVTGVVVLLGVELVRLLRGGYQRRLNQVREAQRLLLELLRMVPVVRANAMEEHEGQRFEQLLNHSETWERGSRRLWAFVWPSAVVSAVGVLAFYIGFLGIKVAARQLTVGEAVVVSLGLLGCVGPAQAVWALLSRLGQALPAASRLAEFLSLEAPLAQAPDARFLDPQREEIRFEEVSKRHQGRWALDRFSLSLPVGSCTALVSLDPDSLRTLALLLVRLIDPEQGRILIDGTDIRELTLESLRAQVGIALEGMYVFSDTVAANISCGDPSIPLVRVTEAAKVAHAHQFIQRLPYGYDTLIGPLGVSLTTGEQFRVALARLVLRDPAIAVIEEPTEGLDADTKTLVDDTMRRFRLQRTMIFLARRMSTLRNADRVVVVHEGQVVGVGTHLELSQQMELYRHIQYVLTHRKPEALVAGSHLSV